MHYKVTIYGLYDPISPDTIKYVGQSSFPDQRLKQHQSKKDGATKAWVSELQKLGRPVCMRVLEVTDHRNALIRESAWIDDCPECINRKALADTIEFRTMPQMTLKELEQRYIQWTLEQCQGNKQKAAKSLGLGRQTLYNKLESMRESKAC